MSEQNIIIYTDGACSGNPGPGGWASIVISDFKSVIELGDYEAATTNNRMELQAVIKALIHVEKNFPQAQEIQIYTDSVYVIRGITQWIFGWKKRGWKTAEGAAVTNQDLWENLDRVVQKLKLKIKWDYVRGHKGTAGNERCDEIAVAFSKRFDIYLYEGPAKDYHFDVHQTPPTEPLPESNWNKPAGEKKASWYLSLINGVVTKYPTWSLCEAAVKGRPGVKFKKVSSPEEEQALLKSWGKS